MRCVQLFQKAAACVAVLVFVAGQVQAAVITFDLAWSGVSYGNSASAVGTISLEDSLLPNPGFFAGPLSPTVTALSITVSGAAIGNGTFNMSDFDFWVWDTNGATLDLSSQLVGQNTLGNPWGTPDAISGGFNLYAITVLGAPAGNTSFTLTTNNGNGDSMLLTSFSRQTAAAAVPEPTSIAIFGIGAGLMSLVSNRRRCRQQRQTATA